MEQIAADEGFDRDIAIAEIFGGESGGVVTRLLAELLGGPVSLRDEKGRVIAGDVELQSRRVAVRGTLEPIGWLEGQGEAKKIEAAAQLLEQIIKAELRYRMASSLHLASVRTDYEVLKEKHAALIASEQRYKELAAHLEQRVEEQVARLESTQRQLYQAEKLASVGQLAAGVAHEINTPIGFIRSNLNTASRYRDTLEGAFLQHLSTKEPKLAELFADFSDLLRESLQGTERVERIVAALKNFSRVDRQELAPTDLNEVIGNAVEMVRPLAQGRVEFVMQLTKLPPLFCNAGHMGQVMLNLLSNSVQAIEGAGRVQVGSASDSGEIVVTISDTGKGIASADLSRIFDPFFTTKEVGKGTGLGLTVCNDIVRAHGGVIEAASSVGKGTEMRVRLPLAPVKGR